MKWIVASLFENKRQAYFTEEGLEGANRKSPDRPVSLMSLEARQTVDSAVRRGLCYKRFTADITLDCTPMPPTGSRLICDGLVLEILPERKKCWPECKLFQTEHPCPLRDGVRYARVEQPGRLCLGDEFTMVKPATSDPEAG
jgi:hypothetical protein